MADEVTGGAVSGLPLFVLDGSDSGRGSDAYPAVVSAKGKSYKVKADLLRRLLPLTEEPDLPEAGSPSEGRP